MEHHCVGLGHENPSEAKQFFQTTGYFVYPNLLEFLNCVSSLLLPALPSFTANSFVFELKHLNFLSLVIDS